MPDLRSFALWTLLFLLAIAAGCEAAEHTVSEPGGDADADADNDADSDVDTDADGDSDAETDADTDTQYQGPAIPATCEQAELATTTVGCRFFAVDLDVWDWQEGVPFAVAVSNVNQEEQASVTVYIGDPVESDWNELATADVPPMSLYVFDLPDYHMNGSGTMPKGSFQIESDVPIIAYQFNPLDGAGSYTSDASMLIPVSSLSETYDILGAKQSSTSWLHQAYFTIVAVTDGTVVTVTPSVAPSPGGVVPATATPFTAELDEGDLLEVQTSIYETSMTGSRIEANEGHPIAVFSGHECATIPNEIGACDHLEEQVPGLRFWGTELVAARMPVRSVSSQADTVMWQIYASEDETEIELTAADGVSGIPESPLTLDQGEVLEFFAGGSAATPGDFFVEADKPIGVAQYMTGAGNPNTNGLGDPAMAHAVPTEQLLPRYVVLVPETWINDVLIITRLAGSETLLDDEVIPDSEFVAVADSGFEVARLPVDDGIHTLFSANGDDGVGVTVVGWDEWDSYAYTGGMGLAAINPDVE
jgi:hypothetical protein